MIPPEKAYKQRNKRKAQGTVLTHSQPGSAKNHELK